MKPEDRQSNYWKPENAEPVVPTQPQVQAVESAPPQSQPTEPPVQPTNMDNQQVPQPEQADIPPLQWTAQEYVHLDKGTWWYVIFAAVAIGLIALDIFLMKSYTFSALVVVMAIAVIVYIRRPPRALQYAVSVQQGLYVGDKLYHFDDFKSFGVIDDDGHLSIMLIPVKRFAAAVSVYFPEEIGEQLVDMLALRLPMEELKLDPVDVLIRKLRF